MTAEGTPVMSTTAETRTSVAPVSTPAPPGPVISGNATDGQWDRGVPVDCDRGDPDTDGDGSGQCWLTDNVAGNSDVDGGPTRITSPSFDLSGGLDYTISYARWFGNNSFDADDLLVEISNNGGSTWTTVESTGETFGWTTFSFDPSTFVTLTSDMVVRFNRIRRTRM